MKKEELRFGEIPGLLYTVQADRVFLFVHGKGGNKEEASLLAEIACEKGWDVVGIDLPGWGERTAEAERFVPWETAPELRAVYEELKQRYFAVALFANSIGAYFSLLSLGDKDPERALLVSPVTDMERLIRRMMGWAAVTPEQLEKEREIPTAFGETLSWPYLCYVKEHPVTHWNVPTRILYAGRDELVERESIEDFVRRFGAELTVMEEGEHWFHTEEQLSVLRQWIREGLD